MQQRQAKDRMDAGRSCWMGLREGRATEMARKGSRIHRDKQ